MDKVSVEGRVGRSQANKAKFSWVPGSTFPCNKNTSHLFSSIASFDPVAVRRWGKARIKGVRR